MSEPAQEAAAPEESDAPGEVPETPSERARRPERGARRQERTAWQAWLRGVMAPVRRRLHSLSIGRRALLRRYIPNEAQHMFALTLAVGVVCGLVAVAFHLAIRATERLLIDRALHAEGSAWMFWTVASPTVGGLLAGAALTYIVPGARGSGIPQVKQAFAVEGGRVRFRDALGKFIVGSLQIGSGASLGREGPTVQICAGAASLLARATSLPPRNMRRLTPVGVAAGIAAAFNAPIAAVTFTIEEIVGTLDQAVLSGVVVAAALAAVIERGILGANPVIHVDQSYGLDHASSLAFYAVLGVAAAVVSVAFTDSLLGVRRWFRSLRAVPAWSHPGIGGLVTGVLAVALIRFMGTSGVTGGGYETLGRALAGQLGVRVLVVLCLVKLVATVFSYSSGGAGGIFAPSLFIGAMLGGAIGHLDVVLLHHEGRQLGAFALVGMGAVFAGVIRAPITSVLIIFEMTGDYGLVLPLMLANMTSYILARRWRPLPIYEALLEQDGVVLPHSAPPTHTIEQLAVGDAMSSDVIATRAGASIADALEAAGPRTFSTMPVLDDAGDVTGLVALEALRAAAPGTPLAKLTRLAHTIRRDAPLLRAVIRMNDLGVRQLHVVDREAPRRVVGVISMSDVVRAHSRPAAPSRESLPGALAERRAGELVTRAPVVRGDCTLAELTAKVRLGNTKAFIVEAGGEPGEAGVILAEHLSELVGDDYLEKILIAADLARPAPTVRADAELSALVAALEPGTDAVIVLDEATQRPRGVVTKAALASAFLDWYASLPEKECAEAASAPSGSTPPQA